MVSFTDEIYLQFSQRRKEISRMTRYWQLFCVIQAAGETLSLGGILSLIVLYLMIFTKLFCALVRASKHRAVLSFVDLANVWYLCIIAASICSVDHAGSQFAGHTSV